jgi:hypothetical protein
MKVMGPSLRLRAKFEAVKQAKRIASAKKREDKKRTKESE